MSDSRSSSSQNPPDHQIFKILIASDIHLGYEESLSKKSIRNDSFTTFEEILQLAVRNEVDFMLLGGDLFHDSKPSQPVVLQCINLLKKYCMGNRSITFSFLSNPADVLSSSNSTLNFENENLSVSLPIFTIHGNHDNPSFHYTGTLDILEASGFVNYFSKISDLSKITITPIVLEKGGTYIAIYGISYVGERHLSRLFNSDMVTFLRPNIPQKCFNILVLHQNRAQHTKGAFIAEDKLPEFIDLVFWGHEHECRIVPEEIKLPNDNFYYITQPGSSVATSLSIGESKPKHVGLLKIHRTKFILEPLKLKTIRPFVYDSISLKEIIRKEYCDPTPDGLIEYVDDYIEHTVFEAVKPLLTGHPEQPTLPLIRLKLLYSDDIHKFDIMKITRKYCDRVANATDLVIFSKERSGNQGRTVVDGLDDDAAQALAECFSHREDDRDWSFSVRNGVKAYFEKTNYKLKILSLIGMNEALERCVKVNDDDALPSIIQHQINKTLDFLEGRKTNLTKDSYDEEIEKYHRIRAKINDTDEAKEYQKLLDDLEARELLKSTSTIDFALSDDDDMAAPSSLVPKTRVRGRGSRGPRGSRGSRVRSTSRGRAAKAPLDVSTSSPVVGLRTPSRERVAQTLSQVKSTANSAKSVFDSMSEYENIVLSDSD
ncbi:double-strand break repair protein MRE11 [Chelonus insularis]|uniref:double-strand break repair protein MRE11 n=1 Tax=Chelonus insularis TaxID=460826 RepID=UPI00158C3CC8|nr:double-strand break repair protein MRE11 [Chelonus insularis]